MATWMENISVHFPILYIIDLSRDPPRPSCSTISTKLHAYIPRDWLDNQTRALESLLIPLLWGNVSSSQTYLWWIFAQRHNWLHEDSICFSLRNTLHNTQVYLIHFHPKMILAMIIVVTKIALDSRKGITRWLWSKHSILFSIWNMSLVDPGFNFVLHWLPW